MKTLKSVIILVILLFFVNIPTLAETFDLADIKYQEVKFDMPKLQISPATQEIDWTTDDTIRQAVFTILEVIDWGCTRTTANNPDTWFETNPILGGHPSVDQVNTYFVLCLVGNLLIAKILPKKYRKTWQYVSIYVEVDAVVWNFKKGVSPSF